MSKLDNRVTFTQVAVADGGPDCVIVIVAIDSIGRVWHTDTDGNWTLIESPPFDSRA